MAIPDFQSLMLPLLRIAASGAELKMSDVVATLSAQLNLSDEERAQLLPSGRQTTFANRVHWAKAYLYKTALLENTKRGYFRISDRGRSVLAEGPPKIDLRYLARFPELARFRGETATASGSESAAGPSLNEQQTPDEVMRAAYTQISTALQEELIRRILAASPKFFELLIVRLLEAMGYGGNLSTPGRHLGGGGDGGVDGVVDQDALGLDQVYVQAKRYSASNLVTPSMVRAFAGSLQMMKASKGVFVTTSSFTKAAMEDAERMDRRIILIDGQKLAELLIRFNVGVRIEETLFIKKIDEDSFVDE